MSSYTDAMQTGGANGDGPGGSSAVAPPAEGTSGPPPSEGGQERTGEARPEQRRGVNDFFRRLLRPQSAPPEPDPSSPEGPSGGAPDGRSAPGLAPGSANGQPGRQRQERPGSGPPPADPERLTLTRAQLAEFVNGEVNRREAKQKAEADRARRRMLRDSDPLAFADEDRQREEVEEAQTAQQERMRQSLAYYDQHTLTPFLNRLPPDVVEQLRKETGGGVEGLEGREKLIARGTEILEERIRADERRKTSQALRANPALRKQQLLREAESDPTPDPETGGGGFAPGSSGVDPNTQLRAFLQASRSRTH